LSDGIVSWDAVFHLTPDEPRSTVRRFCQDLDPGGSMLLTIGDQAGEVLGWVNGVRVYHSSGSATARLVFSASLRR
jgi:hypothetical protein